MFDTVIKGGTVVDGTGAPARTADVAIADGRIVEIGTVDGTATRTIDADGALVTPGWVDAHTHYDGQVTWDDQLEGSSANGVTTVVMGNCGVGFAPAPTDKIPDLIDLMEGVEDIPGTALYEGMPWGEWESFPEYLAFLDRRSWTLDVAAQIAHGALRFYVMGERAVRFKDCTADDLEAMARLVEEAVAAGAAGFSTSRIRGHRAMSGYAVPGTFAPEEELAAIARAIRKGGGAVFQAITASAVGEYMGPKREQATMAEEVRMLGRMSRETGLRFTFSTFQVDQPLDSWRTALAIATEENAAGAHLHPMVAPRGGTVLTTLRGYHLFNLRPTYMRLKGLPLDRLVAELRKPEVKAAILSEEDGRDERPGSMENALPSLFRRSLGMTFPLTDPLDYEPTLDRSLAARARAGGRDAEEYLYDFLLGDGGNAVGVVFGANYVDGNLDACREMLLDPNTVSGLSDAGAHVNFICDMSNPTFHLTHWVRDRNRGEKLPIEAVVAKATGAPAHLYGFADRGTLEVGKRADVNVVDLDRLHIDIPRLRNDLPAGGQRFVQLASGYLATMVHGVTVREHDTDTGARPGRTVRPTR
ncbi:MAG: amidohydrolase family protein [Acidimicrobiia bacterium]|nr:amidohydrolase family protein [Acidimicrobiia bacterium]